MPTNREMISDIRNSLQSVTVDEWLPAKYVYYKLLSVTALFLKREADEGAIKNLVVVKKKMPPNKPLSDSDIKLIDCWLKDGGKEN